MNSAIFFQYFFFFTAAERVYTQSLGLSQTAVIYGKIIMSFERNGGLCWQETILPGPLLLFPTYMSTLQLKFWFQCKIHRGALLESRYRYPCNLRSSIYQFTVRNASFGKMWKQMSLCYTGPYKLAPHTASFGLHTVLLSGSSGEL